MKRLLAPHEIPGIDAAAPLGLRAVSVEPTIGIEPMNLFLTKEALYRLSYVGTRPLIEISGPRCKAFSLLFVFSCAGLERETRLELATFSLEG